MNATFGEFIRDLRLKNGMTLTQLGAKLGLDSANLSKIENSKRDFDQKRLPLLAEIFGLNLSDVQEEFVTSQLANQIYELNCSNHLLKVAEEKAIYRKTIKNKSK